MSSTQNSSRASCGVDVGDDLLQHVLIGGFVLAREQHHLAQLLGEERFAVPFARLRRLDGRLDMAVAPDVIVRLSLAKVDPESLRAARPRQAVETRLPPLPPFTVRVPSMETRPLKSNLSAIEGRSRDSVG